MALKKYTLYFKGKNKYGHEHNFPILSLDLKSMDEFTSNYDGYLELFNSLPTELKEYVKNNLCHMIDLNNNDLSDNFFITDGHFKPIMDVIFKNDMDVLYINEIELKNAIVKEKMSYDEFQRSKLKTSRLNKALNKYNFFKYLYETYVKNKKISCMIDTYEVYKEFSDLPYDELMVAAIATDKDNIAVLCKKLNQSIESRRNLALKFKKLFNSLDNGITNMISASSLNERKSMLDDKELRNQMILNLEQFKNKYDKEYENLK